MSSVSRITDTVKKHSRASLAVGALVTIALVSFAYNYVSGLDSSSPVPNLCIQPEALSPDPRFDPHILFYSDEYSNQSLAFVQGAIRIPTVSYDDMRTDVENEPRFAVFKRLHEYLFASFPLAAALAETVNEYGLLYTIKGKNPDLKPVVLAAHQDVVPVQEGSLSSWSYPPFEAHFDGEFLYGRGSTDTKTSLVGILEAAESLLQQGWQPERTVLLAFGFDEEISGPRGAGEISKVLVERYGKHGIELLVDEGSSIKATNGIRLANIAVTEKGSANIKISLKSTGGHSSQPTDHTAIGVISQYVKLIEDHPYEPELAESNPILQYYQCVADHAPDFDSDLRSALQSIDKRGNKQKFLDFLSFNTDTKYTVRTAQAVDVVIGGQKVNALPELVDLTINHRVNLGSSVYDVLKKLENFGNKLALEHGFGLVSNGKTVLEPTKRGFFNLTLLDDLEPAPVSPFKGEQWNAVAGTTLSIFTDSSLIKDKLEPFAAPALLIANTDTRHYWDVTPALYRFRPALSEDGFNAHTVDERIRWRSHLLSVAWYYDFLQNTSS